MLVVKNLDLSHALNHTPLRADVAASESSRPETLSYHINMVSIPS